MELGELFPPQAGYAKLPKGSPTEKDLVPGAATLLEEVPASNFLTAGWLLGWKAAWAGLASLFPQRVPAEKSALGEEMLPSLLAALNQFAASTQPRLECNQNVIICIMWKI